MMYWKGKRTRWMGGEKPPLNLYLVPYVLTVYLLAETVGYVFLT